MRANAQCIYWAGKYYLTPRKMLLEGSLVSLSPEQTRCLDEDEAERVDVCRVRRDAWHLEEVRVEL